MGKTAEQLKQELIRLQYNTARLLYVLELGLAVAPEDVEFQLVDRLIPIEFKSKFSEANNGL